MAPSSSSTVHRRLVQLAAAAALATTWFTPSPISVVADDLYLEGYVNQNDLPGSLLDPRGIPNLPFGTETNRFSDGVTSTDPYDAVSSNFPIYEGPIQTAPTRYLSYIEYLNNAKEQGIAVRGSGDSVIEDARMAVVRQIESAVLNATLHAVAQGLANNGTMPNVTLPAFPPPTKNFTVYAAIKWNPSGFAIQAGETYAVFVPPRTTTTTATTLASGLMSPVHWEDGNIRSNAEGYTSYYDAVSNCYAAAGRCRSYLRRNRRFPDANWMSLVCSVGLYVRPMGAVQDGNEKETNWLPLDESRLQETMFYVGEYIQFKAVETGELICFANDAHNLYWNNKGSILVTAVRMSWPPSNDTYYQPLYRPACDSAIAVYANGGINVPNPRLNCNPVGGGSAWTEAEVNNQTVYHYASGAPQYLSYVPKGIVL